MFIAPIVVIVLFLVPTHYTHAALWDYLNPMNYIAKFFGELFYTLFVFIGTVILTFGGSFLDWSVRFLIVEMGDWFTGTGGVGDANLSGTVAAGWTLIRDVLNLAFIFGLVWIGIKTILNSEDSGTRRALGYLIAAALLINFSLLITQVIIDFSNLLAAQIYAQLDAAGGGDDSLTMPITSSFLNSLGLTSILGSSPMAFGEVGGFLKAIVTGLMVMIFFSIAGLIFALGSILVITRFIALTFYMIFSPLMFIGWILPQFQDTASKWWKGFFKYVWFGPIFLFLIYLSAAMTQNISAAIGIGGFADYADSGEFDAGLVETVLMFAIAMGLLFASLKIADKLSIAGGKLTVGIAYRNTVGRGADYLRKTYEKVDQIAESEDSTNTARYGARAARALAGGETGRRAVVKARDYGAGGAGSGWSDTEKANTERKARATRSNRLDKIMQKGEYSKLSKAQLLDAMKNPTTRAKILANGGVHSLTASQVKDIRGSDLDDGIINEVNSALGAEIKDTSYAAVIDQKSKKRKEIATLDEKVLTDSKFLKELANKEMLDADFLQNVSRESSADKKKIGQAVLEHYGAENDMDKLPPDIKAFMMSGAGASFLSKNIPKNAAGGGNNNDGAQTGDSSGSTQSSNNDHVRRSDMTHEQQLAARNAKTDRSKANRNRPVSN